MGWFDKKSWQKRRKIKDLQADLIRAEREGKYVVEQGLFFAELQDMGEATMMLFGASNELSGSEESVIRSFFDRNGFSVEALKLDRSHSGLAEVEIIPPEEVTRWVGRILKAEGYRLIDDSEEERPAELARRILPLSSLVRGIIILFCDRVQTIISTTGIKMNKEGNRLLHWMPQISKCLQAKVDPAVLDVMKAPFEDAYGQFFLRIGTGREFDRSAASTSAEPTADHSRIPSMAFPSRQASGFPAEGSGPQTASAGGAVPPAAQPPLGGPPAGFQPFRAGSPEADTPVMASLQPESPTPTNKLAGAPVAVGGDQEVLKLTRALEVAEAVARMYKSLVHANSSRCVKNTETLLEEVSRLFQTSATCVMVKIPNGTGLTIHAQAGKKLVWGEGGGEGYPVSSSVLSNCIRQRTVVTNAESGGDPTASMIAHQIDATAAVPIFVKDEIVGILYLDRRGGVRPFTSEECVLLGKISRVFEDFPDLTLGLV